MVKGGSKTRQHRLKRRSKATCKGNRPSVLSKDVKAVVGDSVSQVVQRVRVDFVVNSEHEQTVVLNSKNIKYPLWERMLNWVILLLILVYLMD